MRTVWTMGLFECHVVERIVCHITSDGASPEASIGGKYEVSVDFDGYVRSVLDLDKIITTTGTGT